MRIAPIVIMAAMFAAPAAAKSTQTDQRGEAQLAQALEGYVAGPAVRCVNLNSITNQTVIDGTAIIFWGSGGKAWVNRPDGAQFLRRDNILVTKPFGGENCRLDIVHQLDQASRMEAGSVGLNDFTVYTKVKTGKK